MPDQTMQRSFAGGELAPALTARADTAKYQQGLKTCRNFFVRKEGGVSNRAGYRFISACKDDVAGKRLMRFTMTTGSSVLIEIGTGYFRFFRDGAAVTIAAPPAWSNVVNYVPGDLVQSGGVNYYCITANLNDIPPSANWHPLTGNILEIPTPYPTSDRIKWRQTGNVVTITHTNHRPRELVFESLTRWILQTVVTTPTIGPPGGLSGVAGGAGARTFLYVITTAAIETYEESVASSVITIAAAADPTAAAPHQLGWTAVPGAAEYYVYADPYGNGIFGFVGTALSNVFFDPGFIPDFNVTPPLARNLFSTTNNFPKCSANYQQRRFFGNTNTEPDSIFGSRTGFLSNFGIASPLQDDDAITFRVAGNNNHPVHEMVAMKIGLVLLTGGGEWTVTGAGGAKNPISPNSIDAEQETYVGCSPDVPPVLVGNTLIYLQARGNTLHDLRFAQEVEGLAGRDLTTWATHLFERKTIVAKDFAQTPDSIVWAVRSDGTMLGLTYLPEQDVWGWHRHDTYTNLPGVGGSAQSVIEDVCVVPETDVDTVYVIVARVIGGTTKRFIERLERRAARDGFFNADSFFVDCGLSYSGAAATVMSGLSHLNGQVVAVLADGVVVYDGDPEGASAATYTVTAGSITLPTAASNVHIGLPIRFSEIELLDLDVEGSNVRGKKKRVNEITLLLDRSSRSFRAGPDSSNLRQFAPQAWESQAVTDTGGFTLSITSEFTETGRVFIRQTDPLPLTILGVLPNIEVGG